jgi:hypothetical protein
MNPTLLLSLILLGASLAVARQADAPAPSGAPPVLEALPLPNALPQAQQTAPPNETEAPDAMPGAADVNEPPEASQTTAPTQPGDEARDNSPQGASRRRDGRQSRQNRFARERQRSRSSRDGSGAGTDSGTNGPASLDYAAFRVIAELNIFDPNRVASGPAPVQGPSVEYFGLVGTARYDKGTFAVFSGSSSKYDRGLKVSDSIAGYKVKSIAWNSVKLTCVTTNLAADSVRPAGSTTNLPADSEKLVGVTNEVEMRMGQRMRREETGPWQLSTVSSSSAADSSFTPVLGSKSSGTNSAALGGGESEILKRMMQRRDSESK